MRKFMVLVQHTDLCCRAGDGRAEQGRAGRQGRSLGINSFGDDVCCHSSFDGCSKALGRMIGRGSEVGLPCVLPKGGHLLQQLGHLLVGAA